MLESNIYNDCWNKNLIGMISKIYNLRIFFMVVILGRFGNILSEAWWKQKLKLWKGRDIEETSGCGTKLFSQTTHQIQVFVMSPVPAYEPEDPPQVNLRAMF